jgi:hypothetical protein
MSLTQGVTLVRRSKWNALEFDAADQVLWRTKVTHYGEHYL